MTRELAIKILSTRDNQGMPITWQNGFIEAYDLAIEALERKHGEWIFNPNDAIEAMFTKPKCSKCGFESADGGNYCPNCGADMRSRLQGTEIDGMYIDISGDGTVIEQI